MLPLEHSAILLTCIKLPSVLDNPSGKTIFGLLFEWPFKTGFTVLYITSKLVPFFVYQCLQLRTFPNSLDPDQDRQIVGRSGPTECRSHSVGPDLDPNHLTF